MEGRRSSYEREGPESHLGGALWTAETEGVVGLDAVCEEEDVRAMIHGRRLRRLRNA